MTALSGEGFAGYDRVPAMQKHMDPIVCNWCTSVVVFTTSLSVDFELNSIVG